MIKRAIHRVFKLCLHVFFFSFLEGSYYKYFGVYFV